MIDRARESALETDYLRVRGSVRVTSGEMPYLVVERAATEPTNMERGRIHAVQPGGQLALCGHPPSVMSWEPSCLARWEARPGADVTCEGCRAELETR